MHITSQHIHIYHLFFFLLFNTVLPSYTKDTSLTEHIPLQELFNSGVTAYKNNDLKQARDTFLICLERQPENATLLHAAGLVHRKLGDPITSIKYYEKVCEQTPYHANAAFGLAQSYHTIGDIKRCWQLFNVWRKEKSVHCPQHPTELRNKKSLIRAEWGLGDMIHFIRYAREIKNLGGTVIVEAPRPLVQLLQHCWYIDHVIPKGAPLPSHDYEIPLLYLPTLFKTTKATIPAAIPYLYPNEYLVKAWHPLFEKNQCMKIGICWDIGHHDTDLVGWKRAAPLHNWHSVLRTPNTTFYCLQKENLQELKMLASDIIVHHFGQDFDTKYGGFMDTAAIMHHLDLVITVDTAIAHLAGALGIPVWVPLPRHPDYRWMLNRSDTPWYPTMTLFRQQAPGDWKHVFAQITNELQKLTENEQANA